jgi:DNA invertase Pin-like site-specific DNA recombinase
VTTSELITPARLSRQALIYVRQSTPQQVLTNTESQRLQYALRQRAIECGWRNWSPTRTRRASRTR